MKQQLDLNNSNISTILNSKLGLLRDHVELEINQIDKWINSLTNQSKLESNKRKERCEICNSKEDYFEGHHIAGRKHDYRQVTVCKPCHRWLSDKQKTWDKRWEKENLSENLRDAFFLQGLQDILILKSKKTGNSLYDDLGYFYTENISELLKRG